MTNQNGDNVVDMAEWRRKPAELPYAPLTKLLEIIADALEVPPDDENNADA